jgi:TRAP-type C4-dicarboxylate transport system substrate-binding protein
MVQPVFFAIAGPVWDKLDANQKKALGDACLKTATSGSEARLADEKAIAQALGERGLAVDAVDLGPFRASADKVYADTDIAKAWDAAGLQRVQKA